MQRHITTRIAVGVAAIGLLAGCASAPAASETETDAEVPAGATEVDSPEARLAVSHEDGVLVLDASTLEVLADIELDDPVRLATAGDGRHVALASETGVRMLDTGAWTDAHGDHGHSYTADPALADAEFPMSKPSHIVAHGERTALYSDGDGTVTLVHAHDLAEGEPETELVELRAPHHGVAVPFDDGTLLVSDGDEEELRSAVVLDESGAEIARTDECPDLHGEATAEDDRVVLGCTGGVVVWGDGVFVRVAAPDADASIGTARGSDASPVVLANYRVEGSSQDAEGPRRVALVDTLAASMTVVPLPAGYASSTLARTDDGEHLVLGTDGVLRVLDERTGAITGELAVLDAWKVPEDYTEPRPTLTVLDDLAWITDPATSTVRIVDLDDLELLDEAALDVVPNQLVAVTG